MAIDTLAKRASVASLALAFIGPSVVPSGTIDQAERQVIAHSYYGITAGSSFVTIGDTSQIGDLSSTGGITLERVIGGTSQFETFDSTGGVTLERVIGGTSQLEAFTSSGGITSGVIISAVSAGGHYYPAKRVKTKLRKKDDEILQQVYELVAQLDEVPKAKKLVERARKIEVKAKKVIQVKDYTEHDKQIKVMKAQINKLETAVKLHVKAQTEDEDAAIKALLEIM